jgi:hypothetical protein
MPNEEDTKGAAGAEARASEDKAGESKTGESKTGQNKAGETKAATGSGADNKDSKGGSQQNQGAAAAGKPVAASQGQDAIALIKADHRKVEQLFKDFETADDRRKAEIVETACQELILHTLVEEEIFYPACRREADDEEPLDEAQVEHDSVKLLIVELLDGDPDDPFRDARFKVLAEQVKHHVAEEEKPREGILAKAQSAGVDTAELGRRILERKRQLQGREGDLRPTRPVSFQRLSGATQMRQEYSMPRDNGRDRDERGRFTSDDDDRGSRGRYASERNGGGSRRYADDDRDSRGRGRGGWFGDSEGHSEAARRGWDDPDHGPSGWYGDSRGHSEAARRGWDNPDHGPSGWYGDSRGHSEASRRGWDNPDHGRSGWYGDPEGHSEASRRGWDDRRSFRDDDDDRGRSRSRSRDDDDDRGYRSRGRGDDDGRGWYGDSRGHSEAARRGWDERDGGRSRDDDDRGYRSRSRDDDDDRGYRSRGRDDDDDRRGSSRGRGQGGWFGDSRGHAEAARKGWEDRR